MRMDANHSVLLVVDVQQKLLPVIDQGAEIVEQVRWLIGVAQRLAVPVLATEQYPLGLGRTVPELRALLPDESVVSKEHFSALTEDKLWHAPGATRQQWIVTGTESHVCVLQTVLDLLAAGRAVFVVEEAVGSRRARDKALALERMRQQGATIVSREMVAFEWLKQGNSELFRSVLKQFVR